MRSFGLTIYPSFWIVALLIAYLASTSILGGFFWVFVVLVSVVLHELGHAWTARAFGQRAYIELGFFGGATYRGGPTLSPAKDFLVVLMGPLVSLFLGGSALYIVTTFKPQEEMVQELLTIFAVGNLYWTFLNILPVLPLDGGKLMQIVVCSIFRKTGERISYFLSFLACLALMVFFFLNGGFFVGLLFLMIGFENYRMCTRRGPNMTAAMQREVAAEMLKAEHEWETNHPDAAIARLEKLCDKNRAVVGLAAPIERLAKYLLITGRPKVAMHYLTRVEPALSNEGLKLMQLAAYEIMEWRKALEVGEKIFADEGGEVSNALINAFSAARLLLVDTTINWLLSAKEGLVDMKKVLRSEDFDLIRDNEKFLRFVAEQESSR
jgi:Zn-dependent protease